MADLTPMVKQYQDIKAAHQDAILFYRLGDFYEMFNEDAELASRELDLTLTGRGKEANRMPMCGIPYHAAEGYIAKLIEKGYKVAICEQVEDPKTAAGVVKREVVRIITPGTVSATNMLREKQNNYLLAVNHDKGSYGLAYVDASTGEFRLTEIADHTALLDEVKRLNPAEVIWSDMLPTATKKLLGGLVVGTDFKDIYDQETAEEKLLEHFKIKTLESFGLSGKETGLGAAAAIIAYLQTTQKSTLGHLNTLKYYQMADFMFIDAVTRRNLELTQTVRDKNFRGSLLWVLDQTKTAMGSRLLRQWLLQPLLSIPEIEARLAAVAELAGNSLLQADLKGTINNLADIERLTGKVANASANARDLVSLKESLLILPQIKIQLGQASAELLQAVKALPEFTALIELIEKALVNEPPFTIKDGGLIKLGYNPELDELKKITGGGRQWIADLETRERQRTGIKSLKVGFTKVFGYYIEITNSNLTQVPADYIRKQTLVNAERFITPELKERESLILNADERVKELEYQIFCQIRTSLAAQTKQLQLAASLLAQTDVLLSLADVAVNNHYCRPEFAESEKAIKIVGGRHPVVEQMIGEMQFVPNDVDLSRAANFLLITGPNMGGKSTYMRQVALIALLAQIGSFVPAKSAELCLIDRIFTRIGAMDDIYSGQSTFMVEMTETANIINNATSSSLIILDEIGRGTATFDGMSIAAAVAEYIQTKIMAKTLFATHYHEITQLADKHPGIKNLHVTVREAGDNITFLHRIVSGPADRSYGIQVAQLAGLPAGVVKRAREIYNTLEMVENNLGGEEINRSKFAVPGSRNKVRSVKNASRDQTTLF